jgi:hypothetical protein
MSYYNLGSMVDYLDLYEIEKERYAKEMAINYSKYVRDIMVLKWEILGEDALRGCSYDEWKKNLKK